MLVGRPPFETNSLKETYERIKRCDYRLPSAMKPTAASLIHSMLQPDPKKRPTVREILNSEFFDGIYLVINFWSLLLWTLKNMKKIKQYRFIRVRYQVLTLRGLYMNHIVHSKLRREIQITSIANQLSPLLFLQLRSWTGWSVIIILKEVVFFLSSEAHSIFRPPSSSFILKFIKLNKLKNKID